MTVPFVKVTHNGVVREETLSLSYIIRSLEWNDDEGKRRSLPIRDLRMFLRSSKSDQLLVFMTDRANRSLLNSASVSSRPSIMPRPKSGCYFLDVGDIKLLCRQEQVLVVDNGSALSQHFINSLCKGIKAVEDSKISPSPESNEAEVEHLPFELQVLETALACVTEKYYRQLGSAAPLLEAVIESTIDNPTDYQSYGRLTALKKSIFGFAQHVQACLSAVQDLLGNNRDMADLYLSDPEDREESDHDEAELLLEAYASELTLIQMKALAMLAQIDDTVEHINMDLNGQRNRIIRLSLIMEMLAVTAGSGALVGSIFGMNLLSGYENHPDAFYYITGCTSLFMITMLSMLSARFRRHVITNTNRVNQSSFKHIFKIIDEVKINIFYSWGKSFFSSPG